MILSGGHARSLQLLQSGDADLAAIDAVTFALLTRYRSEATSNLRVLGRTRQAPALPYVIPSSWSRGGDAVEVVSAFQAGLQNALTDPRLAAARKILLIEDASWDIDNAEYDREIGAFTAAADLVQLAAEGVQRSGGEL
jgi:ABC-type phosphate/phosphonate transport system substrate-binding protein